MKQYIKKFKKAKIFKSSLILLVFTLLMNISFINTKSYVITSKKGYITKFSEIEYNSLLNKGNEESILFMNKNFHLKYLYIFPEESILILYFFYLIAICGLIITTNFIREKEF